MALKSKKLDTVRTDIPVDVVTQVDLVRINLNVPKTTRALWKSEAAKQGKSLSDMIVEAMELSLSKWVNAQLSIYSLLIFIVNLLFW